MELNFTKKTALAVVIIAALATSSCKKEVPNGPDGSKGTNTNSLKVADDAYSEVMGIVEAMSDGSLIYKNGSVLSCATVTNDTTVSPHVIVIDYGSTGCTGPDGKTRSGIISATYNNTKLQASGTYINAVFDHYTVDDNQINGTATIQNMGNNGAGNLNFGVAINATETNLTDGSNIAASGNTNYEIVAGISTTTKEDDVLSITGSLDGVDQVGRQYHATINSPLIKNRATGCNTFYVQGVVTYVKPNTADAVYDYGMGHCDDLATVTQGGVTTTIHLDQ